MSMATDYVARIKELKKAELEGERAAAVLAILLIPFSFASAVAIILLRGWLLATAFNWFISPVFHAPMLSKGYGTGILFIAGLIRGQSSADTKSVTEWKGLARQVFSAWAWFGCELAIAVAIHHYVQ